MAREFLHGANAVAAFEQAVGERTTKKNATRGTLDKGTSCYRLSHCFLYNGQPFYPSSGIAPLQ